MNLTVDHLENNYVVGGATPDAEPLRKRLDEVAVSRLGTALDGLPDDDERAYFIPELEVELTLRISDLDDPAIAQAWAGALRRSLKQQLATLPGTTVFDDRIDFVASFVHDLLRGEVRDRWEYREFEHLRKVAIGTAIVEVLSADPDAGHAILVSLSARGATDLLLFHLTDTEVETLVRKCLLQSVPGITTPNSIPRWIGAVRSAMEKRRTRTGTLSRNVLAAYMDCLAKEPALGPDSNFAHFLRRAFILSRTVYESTSAVFFTDALASGDVRALRKQLPREVPDHTLATWVRASSGGAVAELVRSIGAPTSGTSIERVLSTRFGGVFLLVPAIVDLKLIDGWSPKEQAARIFVLLLHCLVDDRRVDAGRDPGLAALAGLDAIARTKVLDADPPARIETQAVSVVRRFADRLGAFSESSPEYLTRNFLECPSVVMINEATVTVHFLSCPLQIVLRMAGFDGRIGPIPWLDDRQLELVFD